jgi:hypothetical protein
LAGLLERTGHRATMTTSRVKQQSRHQDRAMPTLLLRHDTSTLRQAVPGFCLRHQAAAAAGQTISLPLVRSGHDVGVAALGVIQ